MFDCTVGLNHREAASPPSGGLLVESRNVPIRRGCMSQSPIAVAVLLVMQNTTHIALAQHAAIFCVQLHSRAACVRVTRHTHESNHCICSKLQHECGVGGRPDAATTHLSTKASQFRHISISDETHIRDNSGRSGSNAKVIQRGARHLWSCSTTGHIVCGSGAHGGNEMTMAANTFDYCGS